LETQYKARSGGGRRISGFGYPGGFWLPPGAGNKARSFHVCVTSKYFLAWGLQAFYM